MTKSSADAVAVGEEQRVFYGWIIVIAATCIYAISAGQVVSFGIFVKPMAKELGWSRASLTGAFGLYILAMSLFSFVAGILVDRLGPRLLNIVGGLALGLGFFLSSRVHASWHFYLSYGLLGGLGFSFVFVSLSSTIPRWFIEKRGLALGILFAGGGVGGLMISPLLQSLIDRYDWRVAFLVLAALACCIVLPAALFLKKEPKELGLKPLGADKAEPHTERKGEREESPESDTQGPGRDYTLGEALKTRPFWIFAVTIVLALLGVMMAQVNMVPHATDKGVPAATAAVALGLAAAFNALGRLVMGAASDKIGTKRSLCSCLLLAACALFWLIIVNKPWMMFLFVVPFGFAYGGLVPQIPRVISELFGVKSVGGILGLFTSLTALGPAFGPVLGGVIFDRTGGYHLAFLIGGLGILIAFFLVLLLVNPKE